jgi:3-oxoacyl-[acyl-carrier protein] reductase
MNPSSPRSPWRMDTGVHVADVPKKILVNAAATGVTETDLTGHLPARIEELYAHGMSLRRIGRPSDVAPVMLFLPSTAAPFLTGTVLPVCGGHAMP